MIYVVGQLTIHDRERYDRYAAGFMAVLKPFGGRLLAADDQPEVVEGKWDRHKVVLLQFPDRAAYDAWFHSEAYQTIARDRLAASDTVALLVHGIEGAKR